jgi:hypothetical protein
MNAQHRLENAQSGRGYTAQSRREDVFGHCLLAEAFSLGLEGNTVKTDNCSHALVFPDGNGQIKARASCELNLLIAAPSTVSTLL